MVALQTSDQDLVFGPATKGLGRVIDFYHDRLILYKAVFFLRHQKSEFFLKPLNIVIFANKSDLRKFLLLLA